MDDSSFRRLVDGYLEPPGQANPDMEKVEVIWERDSLGFGSRHIWTAHGVTEDEVEQVLLEIPPYVEARRHPGHPNRTVFWGATRLDRWLIVVCEDWVVEGKRFLRPITAFEPAEGVKYWEKRQ